VKLQPLAPISEARHEKKLHAPVRFRIENLGSKSDFNLDDVNAWMKPLIESLCLEIDSMEVNGDEILFHFK
jgi:hypothetical protein